MLVVYISLDLWHLQLSAKLVCPTVLKNENTLLHVKHMRNLNFGNWIAAYLWDSISED